MGEWFTVTISTVSLVFSCVSTVVAGLTAFYTLVRRPKVKMTCPTLVAFAFDGREEQPKLFTRALLYCTAAPGKVIEAMYTRIKQGEQQVTYTFWSYMQDKQLVPGGGMFVGPQGIVTNHHFVAAKASKRHVFVAGPVAVDICARVAGEKAESALQHVELSLTEEQATALNKCTGGVFFERDPDSDSFHGDIDQKPGVPQVALNSRS